MAAKRKKTTTKKKATTKQAEAGGTLALVLRVPPAAMVYIDKSKGDRPRTAFLRDILAKGDARLGKILGAP